MNVSCPALTAERLIPSKHAFRGVPGGQNISVPLAWSDVPAETKSFVLTIIDRHPIARNWVHWYVIDIPGSVREIAERASGDRAKLPGGAIELRNSYGEAGYGGPKPPRGSGPHEYVMSVHAMSCDVLGLSADATPAQCERALKGKVLGSATVVGMFEQ